MFGIFSDPNSLNQQYTKHNNKLNTYGGKASAPETTSIDSRGLM